MDNYRKKLVAERVYTNPKLKLAYLRHFKSASVSIMTQLEPRGFAPLGPDKPLPEDYDYFTFVRHPYDRLFSAYWYVTKRGGVPKKYSDVSFMEFLALAAGMMYDGNVDGPLIDIKNHTIPQHLLVGEVKNCFTGKVENMEVDWRKLQTIYTVDLGSIEVLNKNKHKPDTLLTPHTKDFIYNNWTEDFKMFNYERFR